MKIETILNGLNKKLAFLVSVVKAGDSRAKGEADVVATKCEFAQKLLDAGVEDTDEVLWLVPPAPAPAPATEPVIEEAPEAKPKPKAKKK